MVTPRAPIFLTHSPTPRVEDFARLAALEAGVRGILLSVMPLALYRAFGDAALVSVIYFAVGISSLCGGLLLPWVNRRVPRRWLFTGVGLFYGLGTGLALTGRPGLLALGLASNALATVLWMVCFNAYVLDHIARSDLGRNESTRLVYSAASWMVGPALGVILLDWWYPAPFLLAGAMALAVVAAFWRMRLGNGRQIVRARGPAPNPLAFLGRFGAQPRLVAGWLFAVIRSCGWWVYIVYLPIFCIEQGLGDRLGGVMLSLSNALLFTTPLMLRLVQRTSVRFAVRGSFAVAAALFVAATLLSGAPWAALAALMAGSVCLVMLDVCAGLPFLMAVKPSERTEMAAVYASFRDVSGILTPAVAGLVLTVAPVAGVFAACGAGMAAASAIAAKLHPRLGAPRPLAV
ncbi:putative MFS family arabinose efflux permease [Limimaricola soesokkakensis]|uniref:Major Facilitator Superfamily protein n=1 Tax=Limimaricola soesokkakensis TaxID=1343159 RepID=A0A1X6YLH9_9RHOB|nr:MFS transporter [Limimaricola soesokkakensis]PSK88557.1 putative MFS family arabinose efflux permease [Limimaricola soesokkakensis]SLN23160.1 Major Facilitator Superfamily protein [Limimaricola soesokkakensis]